MRYLLIYRQHYERERNMDADKGQMQHDLLVLRDIVRRFADERNWNQFHTPKNLASALCVEAAELLEPFQWMQSGEGEELDEKARIHIRHEIADVLTYLIRLADRMDVDLYQAVLEKMELNRAKYPAEQVRGDARKYTAYTSGPSDSK